MNQKRSFILIILILVSILIIGVSYFVFTKEKPSSQAINPEFPKSFAVLNNMTLNYSDSWSVKNKGTEGIELTKGDVTILLSTAQIENSKTLDQIVDEKNESLTTKKILNDSKQTINSIQFRKVQYGSLDESFFPSDNLTLYSAIVNKNVYLTFIINSPSGVSIQEAESLVNTIKYN